MKNLNILLIISAVLLVVVGYYWTTFSPKNEVDIASDFKFDQSTFHLGQWNSVVNLGKDEQAKVNLIAVTTADQAQYLSNISESLYVDLNNLVSNNVTVQEGNEIEIDGVNYRLLNLETTFSTSELIGLDGAIQTMKLRKHDEMLVEKSIGTLSFLSDPIVEESAISIQEYTLTYPDVNHIYLEFVNNSDEELTIDSATLLNSDLNYSIDTSLPVTLKPNEPINLELSVNPTDKNQYDFWAISPSITLNDDQIYHLPSTFHKNFEVDLETIEQIIERKM
ncbi:hypothetical protein [Exiguobacterium profundum]